MKVDRFARPALWIAAVMLALVPVVTGNLSGMGIGSQTLLYDAIALPRLAVALVLTAAAWGLWLFGAAEEGSAVRADAGWVLVVLLAVCAVLSAAVSPHRTLSVLGQSERLEGAVTIVLYALLYGLGLQLARGVRDARVLVGAFGASAAALSAFGLLQYAGLDPTSYRFESYSFDLHRAFGTLGNPNFLAGVLVLALPLLVGLSLDARHPGARLLWGVAAVGSAAALFVTFTRGAWFAVAVEGATLAVLWWRHGRGRRAPVVPWLLAGAAVVLGLLLVLSAFAPAERNVVRRVADAFQPTGSARERQLGAGIALDAMAARALTGYGPDTFLPAFRLHRSDAYAASFGPAATLNNAHSWPLQYAATLGAPGAMLLLATVLVALVRSRPEPTSFAGGRGGLLITAVWIGCIGFLVHMLFNAAVLGATVPFWLLLGVLAAVRSGEARASRRVLLVAGGAACLVTVALVVASLSAIAADAAYLHSRLAYSDGDYPRALALARDARARNPLSIKYARGAAEAAGAEVASAIRRGADVVAVRTLYDAALADFSMLDRKDARDYPGQARLAALQVLTGLYLRDERLIRQGRATAAAAAALDRQHSEVAALAAGDTSQAAVARAAGVPRLP